MDHQSCIFCKIIKDQIPSKKIKETDTILVIQDIAPKAPVHYLILPKKHIKHVGFLEQNDQSIMSDMMYMAQTLSKELKEPQEFRLIINNGTSVGQSVFHIHMHFLTGKAFSE